MVMSAVSSLKPNFSLGVKLPPYFDKPHFEMCANILNKYKDIISYAASINTIGNALAIDYHAEMPSIRANNGYAGLSGAAVKYTALANVKQMRELLDSSIDVVGVGGVSSGKDVFEMILCGAQGELVYCLVCIVFVGLMWIDKSRIDIISYAHIIWSHLMSDAHLVFISIPFSCTSWYLSLDGRPGMF